MFSKKNIYDPQGVGKSEAAVYDKLHYYRLKSRLVSVERFKRRLQIVQKIRAKISTSIWIYSRNLLIKEVLNESMQETQFIFSNVYR